MKRALAYVLTAAIALALRKIWRRLCIGENFGATVRWIPSTQSIEIVK